MAVRSWGSSFNPIFFSSTINSVAVVGGAALAVFLYWNDYRSPIVSSGGHSGENSGGAGNGEGSQFPGLVSTGVGFGAALFLMQLLFGDLSVISRYAVATYPDRGPYPYPWG